jgi:hypothetical protein
MSSETDNNNNNDDTQQQPIIKDNESDIQEELSEPPLSPAGYMRAFRQRKESTLLKPTGECKRTLTMICQVEKNMTLKGRKR